MPKIAIHPIQKRLVSLWEQAPGILRRLIVSWLFSSLFFYHYTPVVFRSLEGLQSLQQVSFPFLVLLTVDVFILLSLLWCKFPSAKLERWLLVGAYGLLWGSALSVNFTRPFFLGGLVIFLLMVRYGLQGWEQSAEPLSQKQPREPAFFWAAVLAAVLFFLLMAVWTVYKVKAFMVSTYDFGIFAQMYHYLRNTLTPLTTLERDGLLSHFAVHVSPIFYILLPFYALFPRPETLQVLQAALAASAAIPLWKLGKHHGLPGGARLVLCLLLFLYPAYAGGLSYDFHENSFLTPLILWLFYAIDRKDTKLTGLFAILVLSVKEDAPVYVAVIGLWLLFRALLRKEDRNWNGVAGACLLLSSALWFLLATAYLARYGDGVMSYRYENLIYDGSGSLFTVIKAILISPMKAVFECLDQEKVEYLLLTMLPLAGLPLLTRRYERLVLLIPYILWNLLSDYQYQHSILHQYSFGSFAFLLYLTLVNWKELKKETGQILLLTALILAAMFFGNKILPEAKTYIKAYQTHQELYDSRREILSTIPAESSVAATTFYTTALSQRDTLYDIRYCTQEHLLSCEYIVLSPGGSCLKRYQTDSQSGYQVLTELLHSQGYALVDQQEGYLEIYYKAQ